MRNAVTTTYLAIAGLLLLVIGGAILMAPHAFHGSNGIVLDNNPNMLSEIRAPGGLLASSGFLVLISVFRDSLREFTIQLTVLVYGSFGIARLVSMAQDGMPSSSIVGAMILELLIAAVGAALLWRQHTASVSELSVASATR